MSDSHPGVDVEPLYSERECEVVALGGGAKVASVVQLRGKDLAAASRQAAESLAGGAAGLWFSLTGPERLELDSTNTALEVFQLDRSMPHPGENLPLLVDVGCDLEGYGAVMKLPPTKHIPYVALIDPLGEWFRDGALPVKLEDTKSQFSRRSRNFWSYLVSSLPYHEAGASPVDELALTGAAVVEYLRWGAAGGGLLDFHVRMVVTGDVFLDLAKLRAMRVLWDKVAAACQRSAPQPWLHAVTSNRLRDESDPWKNLLRASAAASAAVLAGVDGLTVRSFDAADSVDPELVARVSRNIGHVLTLEGWLGEIADPAHGSYYVESLTDRLCRLAWARLGEIESMGGLEAVIERDELSGWLGVPGSEEP